MSHTTTELRLTALEREVAQLKRRVNGAAGQAPAGGGDAEAFVNLLPSRGILVPDSVALVEYLRLHPDVLAPLEAGVREAQGRLPNGTELSLELYRDPETADEYPTLYARGTHYDTDLMAGIDEVSARCDALLEGRSGRFLVTTDFLPPRGGRGGNAV